MSRGCGTKTSKKDETFFTVLFSFRAGRNCRKNQTRAVFQRINAAWTTIEDALCGHDRQGGLKRRLPVIARLQRDGFCIVWTCPLDKKRAWSILKNCRPFVTLWSILPSKMSRKQRKKKERRKTRRRIAKTVVTRSLAMDYRWKNSGAPGRT